MCFLHVFVHNILVMALQKYLGSHWPPIFIWFTLPKTNIPKGDDGIPTIHFRVRTVSFREGMKRHFLGP